MNLRARLLYDARLAPHNVLLIERRAMPETSNGRLEIWVVREITWTAGRWAERLDEVLLHAAAGEPEHTPLVARWMLWQVLPLAEALLRARDIFLKACEAARRVKPDGQA